MKIASIDEHDRPREKILRLGPSALSDYELLALILGSGTKGAGVLELAQEVLKNLGGIEGMLRLDGPPLGVKGIGKGKACALAAIAELSRRSGKGGRTLNDVCSRLCQGAMAVEEAYVVSLEGGENVAGIRLVGKGNENRLLLSPPEILRAALSSGGRRFVFVHLHPSGSPYPSPEDLDMTAKLLLDAKKVGLTLTDHLILSKGGQFSFKEHQML